MSDIEYSLHIIVERLTILQTYLRQQTIKDIKDQNSSVNYDLSKYEYECPHHRYVTRIIERKPLIIYIENFLTRNEIEHLAQLAEPLFNPSKIFNAEGVRTYDDYRTSTSANLRRQHTPVVKCLEHRFAKFQGNIDVRRIERFQVVKYIPGQQFQPHYDWFWQPEPMKNGGQRLTTFVTYLQANCSQGETEFLEIRFNETLHKHLCDILYCDEKSASSGLRFRPIPGNTVFWSNVDKKGLPDHKTYHAGRPPGENGYKIGLNVWTRVQPHTILSES
ncbi:unnamed protein product [Adineta ricciae]|uniref:Prolyl 4-hydroxylase alpha subunit domain-containing protein n=1 Tax=Adineta ricciae TaxID=249248 RepID=A0A814TMW3_ADIRI|nr:unnamed protein product [Adineta ricciae]